MAEHPVGSGLDSEQRFGVAEGVGGEEGASRREAQHRTSPGAAGAPHSKADKPLGPRLSSAAVSDPPSLR